MIYRIALLITAAAILVGCESGNQETTSEPAQPTSIIVRTALVEQADFRVKMRLGGNLRGNRQTMIPARVATTVTKILARVGQQVKKGDVLVMLDPGGVQSQYHQMEAVFRNTEKQLKKMRALYEGGAISETQLDGAETEYEIAQANFNAARQSIEIESPFDGVVTDIDVRLGDEVAPGKPIVEVADINSLRLLLDVSPAQANRLKVGQPAKVISPVDAEITMKGSVYSIADAANRSTRSFEVECQFPSPSEGLSPGMYVTAEIETETLASALIVPSEALLYRSGKVMLYVVENDTAALLTVSELATGQGVTAVGGDIYPDQRVVVVGHKNLTPGALVEEAGQ
jgi:RND family efflux transporter MFP subunit